MAINAMLLIKVERNIIIINHFQAVLAQPLKATFPFSESIKYYSHLN
jgi:hypothetical protein